MSIAPSTYERLRPAILAYFRRRVRDPNDAEDLCQEALARAVRGESSLRDPEKVRPYVYQIARNVLLNHVRRRNLVMRTSELGEEFDLEQVADPRHADPEAVLRGQQLQTRLEQLLHAMPAEQRTAFELGVVQRLVYREIAQLTGWSVAKVKINVFRARKILVEGLHEYRDDTGTGSGRGAP
jgi:RNA polymerase sigma-70 factor (ECF subfamily)